MWKRLNKSREMTVMWDPGSVLAAKMTHRKMMSSPSLTGLQGKDLLSVISGPDVTRSLVVKKSL